MKYSPLDETLAQPRVRILRAMRFYDWVSITDLFVRLGVPDYEGFNTPEYQTYYKALSWCAHTGLVEWNKRNRCWRITPAGRKEAVRPVQEYNAYAESELP